MPPIGERLSASEVAVLKTWIDEGARPRKDAAPARANWVPRMALAKPLLPEGPDPNPVDRLLLPYFRRHRIEPPRRVTDAYFARRAYLDAWGLLPTPEQLAAFEASTESGKRDPLVRELLSNSNNYSEHWITFWNDLLRNEEGVNYAGTRKSITAWLLQSLRDNLPYNEFVAQLLNPVGASAPDGFLTRVNWRVVFYDSQTQSLTDALY